MTFSFQSGDRILWSAMIAVLCLALVAPAQAGQSERVEEFSPQEEGVWKERIRKDPANSRNYYHLGRFYDFSHRTREAAEAFHRATQLDRTWPQAFYQLGMQYWKLGRDQEASLAFKRAVLLNSSDARAHHFLGLCMINLGEYEEAAVALLNAYRHDPGWAEIYYDRTPFGMHRELGDREVILKLVKIVHPHSQRLASLLYKRWMRANSHMADYWNTVAGDGTP